MKPETTWTGVQSHAWLRIAYKLPAIYLKQANRSKGTQLPEHFSDGGSKQKNMDLISSDSILPSHGCGSFIFFDHDCQFWIDHCIMPWISLFGRN
jgi:hypothetical protein